MFQNCQSDFVKKNSTQRRGSVSDPYSFNTDPDPASNI